MSLGKRLIETAGQPPIANFNIVTYTGNGSTQSITGVGFQPDLVWIKQRNATNHHRLYDSTRGVGSGYITLFPSLDFAADQESVNGVSSLDSDGFTLTSQQAVNDNNDTYVAWCWKANGGTTSTDSNGTVNSTVQANTNLGFSIATVTNNSGSNKTFGHGLGSTPEWIIRKKTSASLDWTNYFTVLDGSLDYMNFNTTTNKDNSGYSLPTSTVFTVPTGGDWVFYSFVSIPGKTKFGTYSSNASTKVSTGFQPDFIIMKYINPPFSGDWYICDSVRSDGTTGSNGGNLVKPVLYANKSDAEASVSTGSVEIVSDGFYPTNFFQSNGVFYWAQKIF